MVLCVVVSYVIPMLIERSIVDRIGPFWAYVVLSDLVGCAAIGLLTRWSIGLALYVVLTVAEALLLQSRIVSAGWMAWFADAVPTALLCLLSGFMVKFRWKLREEEAPSRRHLSA